MRLDRVVENPNYKPDRATISLAVKPLLAKAEIRPLRFNAGDGMLEMAAALLAVVESLLPNWTTQVGPPSWSYIWVSKN